MPFKIKSPNPNFNGTRGGVRFEKGVGVTTNKKAAELIKSEFGYEVEEVEEVKEKK